jgi:hypothetical protein
MLMPQSFKNSQLGLKLFKHLLVFSECAGPSNQLPSILPVCDCAADMFDIQSNLFISISSGTAFVCL